MPTEPIFTASAAARVLACPASVVLPHAYSHGQAAEDGVAIHEFLRAVLTGRPKDAALSLVPGHLQSRCASFDLSNAIGDLEAIKAEVAYALHVHEDTARFLGENIGRAYDVNPFEVPGTLDFVGRHWEGHYVVGDWKTGQPVTPCRKNPQMLFAASVAMRHHECSEVEGRIVYLHEDGSIFVDRHRFSAFDVDAFVQDLRQAFQLVAQAQEQMGGRIVPSVNEGDHCRYCPAMHSCPAKVALARSMVTDVDQLRTSLETLTPDQAGQAWLKLEKIKKLAEMVEDKLRDMARSTPIVLSDTHELRESSYESTTTDSKKLESLARQRGATDDEIKACKVTRQVTTVKKLKREKA